MKKDLVVMRTGARRAFAEARAKRAYRRKQWAPTFARAEGRRIGLVLLYHRVNRLPKTGFCPTRDLSVHPDQFDAQIRFVKEQFDVIPLRQLVEILRVGRDLPARNVAALTFDDGYEDNLTEALPVLKRHGLPATIFVPPGIMDSAEFLWHDWLEMLLARAGRKRLLVENDLLDYEAPIRTRGEKWHAYEILAEKLLIMPVRLRAQALNEIGQLLGIPSFPRRDRDHQLLTWEQLRQMRRSGLMEVGNHSMNHMIVSALKGPELAYEIGEAHRRLMEEMKETVDLFAYPNGRACDIGGAAAALVKDLGYRAAFSTVPGVVTADTDPFLIPRVDMAGLGPEGVVMKIASVLERAMGVRREASFVKREA